MSNQATEYLEAYAEHSKVIRTWFVAYGIGAPVLLLTNEALARTLKASGSVRVTQPAFWQLWSYKSFSRRQTSFPCGVSTTAKRR